MTRRWPITVGCKWQAVLGLMLALAAGVTPPIAGQQVLLVHLPSAPVEAAGDQAEAVTALAAYLSASLPGEAIEPKIFRRWGDARDFLAGHSSDVVLMLSDASFALDRSVGLTPAYRLLRGGRSTYRRLLVVRGDRPELEKLVDLQGKTVALVETSGAAADVAFLQREVFGNVLDPAAWFTKIEPEVDDFSATASVLYGQADAALVAEYNPLLADHLGRDLRTVFESPELSLPVLSVRESAFVEAGREVLDQAIRDLGEDPLGLRVLTELGIEGLQPLAGAALAAESGRSAKTLAIASADGVTVALDTPPLPAPELLSFSVAVELPEISLRLDEVE